MTLVDLDVEVTNLAKRFTELAELNQHSLTQPRLHLVTDDAMQFLANTDENYDVVIVDFPDPNNFSLGKLYTTRFYSLLKHHLKPESAAVIQSTSPMFARQSFWCVDATLRAVGFQTRPYHVWVPSLRRVGLRAGRPATPFTERHPLPERLQLPQRRHDAYAVPVPQGHGAAAVGGEPAQQPGAGPLLRGRVAPLELKRHRLSRRELVASFLGLTVAQAACKHPRKRAVVPGTLVDQVLQTGHLLRGPPLPRAAAVERTLDAVVVGAGAAGLSAAWRLRGGGLDDFLVCEVDDAPGGTARSGKNSVSAYPWGAHYLPAPLSAEGPVSRLLSELGRDDRRRRTTARRASPSRRFVREPEERLFYRGDMVRGPLPARRRHPR